MKNKFEQISKVSGFMKHNGGLLFRDLSETEFEFKSTIQDIHLNKREITHGGFICLFNTFIILVRLLGFEPRTSWSVAKRSIQLSYRRKVIT